MIFERRHYVALAQWVADLPPQHVTTIGFRLGQMLAQENPGFDWARWNKACLLRSHPTIATEGGKIVLLEEGKKKVVSKRGK